MCVYVCVYVCVRAEGVASKPRQLSRHGRCWWWCVRVCVCAESPVDEDVGVVACKQLVGAVVERFGLVG